MPPAEDADIAIKETLMLVVSQMVAQGKDELAGILLRTPTDVLRYLWYEKTGQVQIIEPRTLIGHARKLYSHLWGRLDRSVEASEAMKQRLRLKYDRRACRRIARWLNELPMSVPQAAEAMNPKRGMWVRMIHALRLGEYSRRPGYECLAHLLDAFYKHDYSTWQGRLDQARSKGDTASALSMLQQTRCLLPLTPSATRRQPACCCRCATRPRTISTQSSPVWRVPSPAARASSSPMRCWCCMTTTSAS